jgi:hypothetical protein
MMLNEFSLEKVKNIGYDNTKLDQRAGHSAGQFLVEGENGKRDSGQH